MLSSLRDVDRALAVKGPQLRQDNRVVLIACQTTEDYDHKWESCKFRTEWTAVAADAGKDFAKWDFVIQRSDGTRCWLHPSYGSQSFHYGEEDSSLPPVQPPKAGRGAWDYRGHYKVLRNTKADKTFTFAKARA